MNKPLPQVVCNKCNKSQSYNGQANCKSCEQRLNNWSIASQLMTQKNAERERLENIDQITDAVLEVLKKHE